MGSVQLFPKGFRFLCCLLLGDFVFFQHQPMKTHALLSTGLLPSPTFESAASDDVMSKGNTGLTCNCWIE